VRKAGLLVMRYNVSTTTPVRMGVGGAAA